MKQEERITQCKIKVLYLYSIKIDCLLHLNEKKHNVMIKKS